MQQKIDYAKNNILCVIILVEKQKHSAEAWSYNTLCVAEIHLEGKE